VLDDATVLLGGLHQFAAFVDIVGKGLFNVNVLARLAGKDRQRTVPVIRGGVDDSIDVLVIEHLPVLEDARGFLPLAALAMLDQGTAARRVEVADRRDLDRLVVKETGDEA